MAAELGSRRRRHHFWGNAKLRYNGINLNKCRSRDFYAFLPHNKYLCSGPVLSL